MALLLRIVAPLYLAVVVVVLAASLRQGNMGGHAAARFLNLAFGMALVSMPLLVLAYAKREAWFGRRQYSLRTMLLVTTLVAVVLGLAVWAGR